MSSTRPYDQIGQDHLSWLPQKQIGPTPRAHEPKTSERREPTRTRWLQSLLEPNRERRIYLTDTLAAEVFLHVATNADPMDRQQRAADPVHSRSLRERQDHGN